MRQILSSLWIAARPLIRSNGGVCVRAVLAGVAGCIARLASRYDLAPAQVLIVHDDLDLAVGRVKLKQGGSDGGHNGLRSTTSALRSDGYWRLRA